MTLTQLEYIVAVDSQRHFASAAESCFVTQPTLSMQIQKLEEELGVKLFDRTKQPVIPTEVGAQVIAQARVALREAQKIRQLIDEQKDVVAGEIAIGIIPTLAPYLLPSLLKVMAQNYPQVKLVVREAITEDIVQELRSHKLDCGLVVTPLEESTIHEEALFYEELFVYVSRAHALYQKKYVLPREIDPDQLWLLEEGHCFRSQVLNLCELRRRSDVHFRYETGNIETLKRMVDTIDGMTILPELAVREFSKTAQRHVKRFRSPYPVREVGLVTHRSHVKEKFLQVLKEELLALVPESMRALGNRKRVEIHY